MRLKAVTVLISGRVQGVFFRYWTRERAQRLGIDGWIRNRHDGAVEGHFEGSEDAVQTLIALCRDGPPGAAVSSVAVEKAELLGCQNFEIKSSA